MKNGFKGCRVLVSKAKNVQQSQTFIDTTLQQTLKNKYPKQNAS
jgi:hypothetical protein